MMKKHIVLSLGFGAMLLAADHAFAQGNNCHQHQLVVERLAERYGESRQSIGLAANNSVVEVFASLETGTWTITVTTPGGPTCLVASGEGYQALAEVLPSSGSPA